MRSMIRNVCVGLALAVLLLGVSRAPAQDPQFDDVAKVNLTLDPATAARGQRVTAKITVELVPGWHTYPTVQVDKNADSQQNEFMFLDAKDIKWEGVLKDPPGYES